METQPLNVIHLDTVTFWRGGQQQVVYLFEGMLRKKLNTALICQPDSAYQKYCECENLSYFTVRMYGEWDILAGFRISRLCKKEGFNIIHAHSAHALTIGIWAKLFNRSLADYIFCMGPLDMRIRLSNCSEKIVLSSLLSSYHQQ